MDHDNLWKVTIVPSQVTSSNDTIALSTRTSSTISEQESKRNLLFNENKEGNENECRSTERSKITSLSSTYQKLNHDILYPSFQSDKRLIYALCKNEKKLHRQINKKINTENAFSKTYPNTNNASNAPFIELGAVYKILDFITDSDPKVSSLTNNCCNEISRILQCLLAQRNDKKLENLLLNDSSLCRCEHCGVISYILGLHSVTEEIKGHRAKARTSDAQITTTEHDCIKNDENKKELKIVINPPDLKNNAQSRIFVDGSKDCRAKYKDELNGIESLPIKKRVFAMKSYIGNSNGVNNISDAEADVSVKIEHKSHFTNNTIKRLFADFKTAERDKNYNSIVRNNNLNRCDSSTAMKVYADIGKEEIVRKISYERKSQIDDVLMGDMSSKAAQKIYDSQRLFEKHGDIYPVIDTMKYLARGQFTILDEQKDELLSKLRDERCTRLEDTKQGQSTILYSSRDDYPQRDSGFWLFDERGQMPEIILDEYRCLPMLRMNGNRENVDLSANNLRRSNMREKIKNTDNWCNYIEKDSLEDCTLLEQRRESDTTTFSASSAENLIHEWIESLDRKYETNDTEKDICRGRRLVSSRASLDIARHVRTQIADDRHLDKVKKSIRQLQSHHDSDIFARLSPKIRRKICHLIRKIVSSGPAKDSIFCHEEGLMTDALNNAKLQHSKSVDASFVHSKEIKNNCANDCTSTKVSELLEDKNSFIRRQDDLINSCGQDLNNFNDSVKIPYENTTISISSDKFEKTRFSDDFTRKITRRIIYKDASLKNIVGNDGEHTAANISTIYRKILENSENMDWDNFQKLVEFLHPGQKELWRDVCKTISEEAKRITDDTDDKTEICIEISPLVNSGNTLKTDEVTEYAREIVFELDMTLKNG